MSHNFKIGDRVKLIDGEEKSDYGVVCERPAGYDYVQPAVWVKWDDTGQVLWTRESNLELLIESEPTTKKISMDKRYVTRDGQPVRILCVDAPGEYPVICVIESTDSLIRTNQFGRIANCVDSCFDLIEVDPLSELKIDDKVMVRSNSSSVWKRRHFAGVSNTDKILTWRDGVTSWSNRPNAFAPPTVEWSEWRLPTKEELGE